MMMNLLETQASEIRSFLGPAPPSVGGPGGESDVPAPAVMGFAPAYSSSNGSGPHSHRPSTGSHSAHGDNSAQPPHTGSPTDNAAKRKASDGDVEASAKQQRSKRNRVRHSPAPQSHFAFSRFQIPSLLSSELPAFCLTHHTLPPPPGSLVVILDQ